MLPKSLASCLIFYWKYRNHRPSCRSPQVQVAATFNALVMSYNPKEISAKHGPANLHRFSLFRQFLEDAGLDSFDQVLNRIP